MARSLLYGAVILSCFCSLVSPDVQGDALYALKLSLNASSNQLQDWNTNQVNPCTWPKISCDDNSNVVMVSLSNMGFSGILSPKIGVLKKLNTLSLQGNFITGTIPEEVGNLTSLTMLDLENNQLYGEIPASLGSLKNLQFLFLNQNNLSGTIPQSLSSLHSLYNLQPDSNGLTGEIPESLFEVPKYKYANL
ncbi:unnamed protein product [Cuscuta campestris]|uniref:Uncharacterized protein n=1 Tax=Cuscuta campestris TaxID=132261 RepID=A0A484LE30_9ASTE|nr:unnamed protein product [Cuscuta campestris]